MAQLVYNEVQKFQGPLKWLVLVINFGVIAVMGYGIYRQEVLGLAFGNQPSPTWVLIGSIILVLAILILILRAQLVSRIDDTKISVKFSPFHRRERVWKWTEVESHEVRAYKPIIEYGGWGIRYGFKNGWAYNVSGSVGLQLILKSGKQLLIGTNKKEELEVFLKKMKEKQESGTF